MRERKRILYWLLVGALIASVAGLSGCGGGDEAAPALGIFKKTVAQTGAFDNVALFDNAAATKGQVLLLADEVNASGFITSMSFKLYGASTGNAIDNVTIKMGHTLPLAGDNLSTTFASNVENGKGSLVTVFGPAPLGVPGGPDNTVFTIPLNGKFNYNGVDDLVIQITTGRSTKVTSVRGAQSSPARIVFVGTDNLAHTTADFTGTSLPDIKLGFSGGTNALTFGGPTDGNWWPFNDFGSKKVQLLYTAKEIDGAGRITGIAFMHQQNVGPDNTFRYSVRIGHTKRGALVAGFDNNFNAGAPVKVADNLAFTYNSAMANGDWFWVPITTPFDYNGVDNLVVEVAVHSGGDQLAVSNRIDAVDTRVYGTADNSATGTVDGFKYLVKFRFAGGTVDVIGNGAGSDQAPFGWTDNATIQNLYRSTELGSKVTVTKIAVRLQSPATTTAMAFPNMVFKLAFRDNTVLGSTFSGNMSGPVTVFSGTFNLPAGLKAGDWIEVPLSTPFSYTPTRNLVLHTVAPTPATAGTFISTATGSRFTDRWAESASLTSDSVSFLFPLLWDLQLTVQ